MTTDSDLPPSTPRDVRIGATDPADVAFPLRWGIIGTGPISAQWVMCLHACAGAAVTAVAARSADRAREFAEKYRVASAYGSYAEMVASPEVDIVYIGTINRLHKEHSILAIEAGKHVLCEKPLAETGADGRAMYAAAEQQWRHAAGRRLDSVLSRRRACADVDRGGRHRRGRARAVRFRRSDLRRPGRPVGIWFPRDANRGHRSGPQTRRRHRRVRSRQVRGANVPADAIRIRGNDGDSSVAGGASRWNSRRMPQRPSRSISPLPEALRRVTGTPTPPPLCSVSSTRCLRR